MHGLNKVQVIQIPCLAISNSSSLEIFLDIWWIDFVSVPDIRCWKLTPGPSSQARKQATDYGRQHLLDTLIVNYIFLPFFSAFFLPFQFSLYCSHELLVLIGESYFRADRFNSLQVSNHVAAMDDPLIIASLLPPSMLLNAHSLRWTLCASDRCFQNPVTSAFFKYVKVLPVSRGDGIYQKVLFFTSLSALSSCIKW